MPHLESACADPEVVFCEPTNYRVEGDDYYYQGEYAKRGGYVRHSWY